MSTGYQQIMERALTLPPSERVALAESMLESVSDEEVDAITQDEWDSAWKTDVQRRLQRIEQGEAKFYSWDHVEQRLNNKLEAAKNSHHD